VTSTNTRSVLLDAADAIQQNVRCQTHAEANGKQNAIDFLRTLADQAQPETANPSITTDRVLQAVLAERIRQDAKWGEQNHPDNTGSTFYAKRAVAARRNCQLAADAGMTAWDLVLLEEVHEALAESDPAALRTELVQVAAVAVAWVEAIDRRPAV
jgi:hypothetical protein